MKNKPSLALVFVLMTGLLLVSFNLFAQKPMNNYLEEWKNIDSLLQKESLPKDALSAVEKIYAEAKRTGNDVQVIKALVYRMMINDQVSEEGRYENIRMLENEIRTAKEPARSILSSIAGGSYYAYLQMNRWRFYNRTRSVLPGDTADIATWDIEQLYNRITYHYENSLRNENLLKQTSLEPFDVIIEKGNVRNLRPTLYDLLAHRALNYFRNDERYLSRPSYYFRMDDGVMFATVDKFVNHRFSTPDTSSLHYKALLLFQDLLRFHLKDADKAALLDADLLRLEFAYNFGKQNNKEELYGAALEQTIAAYRGTPGLSNAMYLLAQWHANRGWRYQPLRDTAFRYSLVEARKWCEMAIDLNEKTEGNTNSQNLLADVLVPSIHVTVEKVNVPGAAFRMLVNYRNSPNAFFRIIKVNEELRQQFRRNQMDSSWNTLLAQKSLRNFSYSLPVTNDYQQHYTEARIDALPIGEYALIVSNSSQFSLKQGSLGISFFHVSNISYVNSGNRYYVLNRTTGQAIPEARVTTWFEGYDYNKQRYQLTKSASYTTARDGYFVLPDPKRNRQERNLRLEIVYGKDRLFLDDQQYIPYYEPGEDSDKQRTHLFTDRSIYRPGQIIYFKGIRLFSGNKKSSYVVKNASSHVELYNANGEIIDSVKLTSNEFGSYHGRFTLPNSGLTGQFRIRDRATSSETHINVEEYKRPKFFVEVQQPKGTYKLNDSVTLQISANSYAGASMAGANVNYRVIRRTEIPMWTRNGSFVKIWPPYPSEQVEVAHGSGVLDNNGNINISFFAIADADISEELQPVFHYNVYADVTDLTGETRSGINSIPVAYQALKLRLQVPELEHADSLVKIKLFSTNIADTFQQTQVSLSMFKLKSPEKLFRERLWQQPDQFIMSRDEYYKAFPYDIYFDEDDVMKWERGAAVFQTSFISTKEGDLALPTNKFDAGWYVVEATATDRFSKTVVGRKYIQLYRSGEIGPLFTSDIVLHFDTVKTASNFGYDIISNIKGATFIVDMVNEHDSVRKTSQETKGTIRVSGRDSRIETLYLLTVKNNRFYFASRSFGVYGQDTIMRIDLTTYRNKIVPGEKETWSVTVKGSQGEKVNAELLTSMYDASLDQFYPHQWPSFANKYFSYSAAWSGSTNFSFVESIIRYSPRAPIEEFTKIYDRLKMLDEGTGGITVRGMAGRVTGVALESAAPVAQDASMSKNENVVVGYNEQAQEQLGKQAPSVQPRKNLNETAFFFPELRTDAEGNISFSFTAPEALTTWKWMMFAHTPSLQSFTLTTEIKTQKQLMVQPSLPRFVRQGDELIINAKISNLSDAQLGGNATLQLINTLSGKSVDSNFENADKNKSFAILPGASSVVSFRIKVPTGFEDLITVRIVARAQSGGASFSDGEESVLPVLSNRMLVTETLPLPYKGQGIKIFNFDKLLKSGRSSSLANHSLTVEFASNPAWYAVQALPYLAEQKQENAEQVFNRFYANALAFQLTRTTPRIKNVIDAWASKDTTAFLSNLEKNQELKELVLQETPWVLDAKNEAQQKKNIALLFDINRMTNELRGSLSQLAEMQVSSGGFVWYPGSPEDRYMTQYIVTGLGRLAHLNALPADEQSRLNEITNKAMRYLDQQIKKDYDDIRKDSTVGSLGHIQIQYLYMRSYFPSKVSGDIFPAYNFFRNEARKNWIKHNNYLKAMIAIALKRGTDLQTAKKIVESLKQSAIRKQEMGMYWKDMTGGYYWYQAPIETQSVMIECFSEIGRDSSVTDDLKTWLLKNKQTNNWKTTRATADACYALLMRGSEWLAEVPRMRINLGNYRIGNTAQQEGTGYFKVVIPGDSVRPQMGNISVKSTGSNPVARPSWGAVYWQYFEDLNKISASQTGLKIRKRVMIQRNTDRGPELDTLGEGNTVLAGDKIRVRMEISSDRELEYVHLKDMRAAGFEPADVISGYFWNGGLGYYRSVRDASVNYFFSRLPKGTHIFEYEMFASQAGSFANGVSTLQCMYAPEFSSHSEGISINVKTR